MAPVQQRLSPEAPPSPSSSRPEESWAFGPPKAMKTGPVPQLLSLEAPLPFVISTGAQRSGEICGVSGPPLGNVFRPEESWAFGPPKAMKSGSCSATTLNGSATLPFVMSTGGVMGLRPTQGMKSGSCSANTVAGSAALPFVISTGAPKERSGEICGVSGPSLEMFFDRAYPDFLLRSTCQEHGSGFPLRKPHEDDQCHGSRQEIRRSVVERSAVSA